MIWEGRKMIDTCRLKNENINFAEYVQLKNRIEEITGRKMKYSTKYRYHYTKDFKHIGFKKIILKNQKYDKNYYYHAVEIELHPVLMIKPDDYISLLHFKDVECFVNRFNQEIKKIDEILPEFEGWELDRIDYAVQFYSEYTPLYINLFQRGDRPDYLKPCYDKKSHRRKQREGSLYLKAEDIITINFYDKYDELSKKHPNYKHLDQAKNLLRIEVQCYNRKIHKMKLGLGEFSQLVPLRGFFEPNICKAVILSYYQLIVGTGAYVTLMDAKKIIDGINLNSKEKLKEVLELVNTKKSIYNARKFYNKKHDKSDNKKFNRYLDRLRAAGLNPVTIPVRKKNDSINALLKNPIHEITNQLDAEFPKLNLDDYEKLIAL